MLISVDTERVRDHILTLQRELTGTRALTDRLRYMYCLALSEMPEAAAEITDTIDRVSELERNIQGRIQWLHYVVDTFSVIEREAAESVDSALAQTKKLVPTL